MGVAGFVTGYLGRFHHCYCHGGVIYGFITWSLALMLSALLILPLTHYVSFYEENLSPTLTPVSLSSVDVNAPESSQQPVAAQKAIDTTPKHLMWGSWILFVLFFLGAFSSSIGACYGMRCSCENC